MKAKLNILVLLLFSFSAIAKECPYDKKDADSDNLKKDLKVGLQDDLDLLKKRQDERKECAGVKGPDDNAVANAALIQEIALNMSPPPHSISSLLLAGKELSCPNSTDELGIVFQSYFFNTKDSLGGYFQEPESIKFEMEKAEDSDSNDADTLNTGFKSCYTAIRTEYPNLKGDPADPTSFIGTSGNTNEAPKIKEKDPNSVYSVEKAKADLQFDKCLNSVIYGTPTRPLKTSPSSLAGRVWASNCSTKINIAESGVVQNLINEHDRAELKQEVITATLTNSFTALQASLEAVTTDSGTDCQQYNLAAINITNQLISAASSAAQIMGTPWSGLAASLLSKPLQNMIVNIGSRRFEQKSIDKALQSLDDDGYVLAKAQDNDDARKYPKYACMLLKAQESHCSDPKKGEAECEGDKGPGTLSESLESINKILSEERVAVKGDVKVADILNTQMFSKTTRTGEKVGVPIPGSGERLTNYEYLFGVEEKEENPSKLSSILKNGLVDWVDKHPSINDFPIGQKETKNLLTGETLDGKKSKDGGAKTHLDLFKKCFDLIGKVDPSGECKNKDVEELAIRAQKEMQKVGDINELNKSYMKSMLKESVNLPPSKTKNIETGVVQISMYELNNHTQTSLFELNAEVGQSIVSTSNDTDKSADRTANFESLFKTYNDYSEDGYVQKYIVSSNNANKIKKNKTAYDEVKNNKNSKHKIDYKSEGYFNLHVYPVIRDCVLGYQLNLKESKGIKTMRDDYKKMCSMLKDCKGERNSIGLPFSVAESDIDFDHIDRDKFDKVCQAGQGYDLIMNRAKNEFLNSQSICGLDVTNPDFYGVEK